jgi:monovalent cation:H+ antiporter-2, CPA2 family
MPHATPLITTIVAAFALAFIGGLVAQRLRLSPIVGYLVAGVILGPNFPGFIADAHISAQLAELGVILLMFGVGLHFSVQDLLKVKSIAVPGAIVQIAFATGLGVVLAVTWDWSLAQGIVFGLALSVASTVVLLRALESQHLVRTQRGQIAVGWLIVEDLAMVLALVLLPVLAEITPSAGSNGGTSVNLGSTLFVTLAKVAAFVAVMLIVGKRLVPWLLARVARTHSRELFTLAVLAIALGIAYASASLFGVSLALGAFFAGVVLSESELSHRAAEDILPFQDAFAVLFFVSVGMLFDWRVVLSDPGKVLAVLFIIVIGKSLAALALVCLYRHPLRTALTVAAGLAQIGEFSFILAGLGLSLGLLPPLGQTLILAGAILSIALNPLVFGATKAIDEWIRGHPTLYGWLDRSSAALAKEVPVVPEDWRDHAVIVGHGRVGSVVADMLHTQGKRYAVVEVDRRIVERLNASGVPALQGDIGDPEVIRSLRLPNAALLVFAIPDTVQLRHALEQLRELNIHLPVVARTHSEAEAEHLRRAGVALVVMGERELALRIGEFATSVLEAADSPKAAQPALGS